MTIENGPPVNLVTHRLQSSPGRPFSVSEGSSSATAFFAFETNFSHFEDGSGVTEELLVRAAKSGDRQAFVVLSKRHTAGLMARITRIVRNREDAEDILQEALLRAFINLDQFQGKSAYATWFTRIAINSALMRLRRACAVIISLDGCLAGEEGRRSLDPADVRDTPEESLVNSEREELLMNAIHRLKPKLRDAVHLKLRRGFSNRQIARALGITVPAVKSRLARARIDLRQLMN